MDAEKKYKGFLYTVYQPQPVKTPWWYEYTVEKAEDEGEGFIFDSFHETYNGIQKLDKKDAVKCAKELIDEYHTEADIKAMFDGEED